MKYWMITYRSQGSAYVEVNTIFTCNVSPSEYLHKLDFQYPYKYSIVFAIEISYDDFKDQLPERIHR